VPPIAAAPTPLPPAENVLARVHGAPGVGVRIVAPLAAAYLAEIGDTAIATATHAGEIRVSGLRAGLRETIVIDGDGADKGFTALADGKADLVMAPQRISTSAQNALASLGDMTAQNAEHVLGMDAQAVIVNPGNQIAYLSRAQIKDLFDGTMKDWGSVGAPAGTIDVYAAPAERDDPALAGIAPAAAPGARQVSDAAAVSQAVAADPRGVGLVDLADIGTARPVPLAETGAAPVSPLNHAAIVSEDYPLASRVYLYTSPKSQAGFAQRFVDYMLSPAGQVIVEQHGLVSPTLKPAALPDAAPPATEADRLKAFVKGARRLSIVFRFQPNSTILDSYGERDLDRVLNYLVSMHDGGDHLLLAGFADNQGDTAANVEVSKKRADAVATLFQRRGLTPGGVEGFGAELPVADNATEAGRERNRRVEVYIKK
jgi:phosphate transport system substrate-binding protein